MKPDVVGYLRGGDETERADPIACQSLDLVGRGSTLLVAWGLPVAALVASIWLPASWKVAVWPLALAWMGAACLVNAARCGRTHCYLTGPFFLLLALAALLHGLDVVPLGPRGWTWLGVVLGVGGGALCYLPARIWERAPRATRRFGEAVQRRKVLSDAEPRSFVSLDERPELPKRPV